MASYEQVLKLEKEKPQGVIRLVEANGFYRAYDHSAFLFHQVIAQHKVTRKFAKNLNQEIVYVGFPMDKLLERIGERSHKKTEFGYDVELAADELPNDADYEEWRKTIPTEAASRGDVNSLSPHGDELFCGGLPVVGFSPSTSEGGRPVSAPAAGNDNGSNLNNTGSNGNYWSSTPNSDNSNNAWNLNFNSSNFNRNNNNRNNGQSVRPLRALASASADGAPHRLLEDLYRAYLAARRHKRGKGYQIRFEMNQERELVKLRDELLERRIRSHLHSVTPRMNARRAQAVVNSSLGVLSHYAGFNVRRVLIRKGLLTQFGSFSRDCLRFYPNALDWAFYRLRKGEKQ